MARILSFIAGATVLLAGAIILVGCGGKSAADPATTTVTHTAPPLPANAVRIHWKPNALVPAARAGHVCITTYKTGHFCASYLAGEIPAAALRRDARAKGWILVTSN